MIETACTFGPDNGLVSVLSRPDNPNDEIGKPAILLLNAGLLHKVGPFRLHVDLARNLSEMGFVVLRMDLAGIGDSESRRDSRSGKDLAILDVKDGMKYVESQTGASTFVLGGLCSGADNAHSVAISDTRVAGIISIDGFSYPTFAFHVYDYLPYVVSPYRWLRFVTKRVGRVMNSARSEKTPSGVNAPAYLRQFPPRSQVEGEMQSLVNRGVNLMYIYSGGIPGVYNHGNQFREMFKKVDFRNRLHLEYFKQADHTFSSRSQRQKLVSSICAWMGTKYEAR